MTSNETSVRLTCIGGAVVDRSYQVAGTLVPGSSNPSMLRQGFGGVARNVAETAARLGCKVSLISSVGDDVSGQALLSLLRDIGVDAGGCRIDPDLPTGEYVAVLNGDGELHLGLAAMDIFDALTPEIVAEALEPVSAGEWVFCDCNLPASTLQNLIKSDSQRRLAINTVSVAKAARLPQSLAGVEVLFTNIDEAAAMVGEGSPEVLAKRLLERGARNVVLTQGSDGFVLGDKQGVRHQSVEQVSVVDVTGAGDAFLAGTLVRLASGETLDQACLYGAELAARTVQVHGSAVPLSDDLIPSR